MSGRFLVIDALQGALSLRSPAAGLICDNNICYGDRGSQYASADYQARLRNAGALCSTSRKGNCYDNAPVESFFASLKRELVHRTPFATRDVNSGVRLGLRHFGCRRLDVQ